MLTTILTNLKTLQHGYLKSSQSLEKRLNLLQNALTEEKQKREALEASIKQLNSTVTTLTACLRQEDDGISS
ncbi:hypothetical protein DX884_22650 [Vibrio fluvialis]|nr:hypothetical protein [Vibrio fluvialis]